MAADLVARGLYVSASPDLTATTARHIADTLAAVARRGGLALMRICSPHCGIAPESGSGGEVYERELLKDLAALGVAERHPARAGQDPSAGRQGLDDAPGVAAQGAPVVRDARSCGRGTSSASGTPRASTCCARTPCGSSGPAALWARRHYRLPVPVVTHHHHLDPSPLNPYLEKRVIEASDAVVTDSEFAKRQLADELGVRTDHVRVVYCGVGPKYARGPARRGARAPLAHRRQARPALARPPDRRGRIPCS